MQPTVQNWGQQETLVIALMRHGLGLKRVSSLCFIPKKTVEHLREEVRLGKTFEQHLVSLKHQTLHGQESVLLGS